MIDLDLMPEVICAWVSGPNRYSRHWRPEHLGHNYMTKYVRLDTAIDMAAAVLWRRDYPNGGSIYRAYESTPIHDKEIYRKEAREALAGKDEG